MSRNWALLDLLGTIFDRKSPPLPAPSSRPLEKLCAALMSAHGEVSGMKFATEALGRLRAPDSEERLAFFRLLADSYDLDPAQVQTAAIDYDKTRDAESLMRLLAAAEPRRQELLRRLNQAPGGTAELVGLRVDLIKAMHEDPGLRRVDLDFRHLFASWFNRGFLVMRQIGWDSPADLLEKIIAYEAVHQITSWDDLRRRVQPDDRRCFGFFHPAMPNDPLIFVEVALTRGIPSAIGPILAPQRPSLRADQADTAVFYSISNCQKGLRGISFGNSLIKQVVEVLSQDLPNIATYVTLSPLPTFADWLAAQGAKPEGPLAMQRAAARYLVAAKAGDGLPFDPVARFHLGNGAEIHALHPTADETARGQRQSHGVMVNYLYDPTRIEGNHEAFAVSGTVAAAKAILALARPLEPVEPKACAR